MERIIDAASSADVDQNVKDAENNNWVASNLSMDLHFAKDGVTMDSPMLVFQRFQNVIATNLVRVTVEDKYFYRPELFAKQVYGSSDLWWLVLTSSGIIRHQEFNRRRIKIFNPAMLAALDDIRLSTKAEQEHTAEIEDLTIFPIRV